MGLSFLTGLGGSGPGFAFSRMRYDFGTGGAREALWMGQHSRGFPEATHACGETYGKRKMREGGTVILPGQLLSRGNQSNAPISVRCASSVLG